MMPVDDGQFAKPFPISLIAGHYLLFDNAAFNYLRRTHNICGVLIGIIPQVPQQNVFLGLPLELLSEETKLLVEKGVIYIQDAAAWHKESLQGLAGRDRKVYLESIRIEGRQAQLTAERISKRRVERSMARKSSWKVTKECLFPYNSVQDVGVNEISAPLRNDSPQYTLFESRKPTSPTLSTTAFSSPSALAVTPNVSLLPPQRSPGHMEPLVPASYPLFAHLHAHKYFITPGLRFGCDYTVYPGDPLRFHSHFLAMCYEWDEEITLLDLVGGGRLGTVVKKGFLVGAAGPETIQGEAGAVRTFCIEWGVALPSTVKALRASSPKGQMEARSLNYTRRRYETDSWGNITQFIPSAKDLLLVGPRMGIKMGSLFLALSEAIDGVLGGRMGHRFIPEPTGLKGVEAITTLGSTIAQQAAYVDVSVPKGDDQGSGFTSKISMESARSFGNVFQYSTSRWALACVFMAVVLNRTHVYGSTRRNLSLGWKVRASLRIFPIILLSIQARWILQSIQCQTSPDFGLLRWNNSTKSSELLFIQNGGLLNLVSKKLMFGTSDSDSCRAIKMVPTERESLSHGPIDLTGSLSLLWPLFETFCFSQFTETLSCAVQGRSVAAETGMTLFEHSLAFAEAEAAVSSSLGWGPFGGARSGVGTPESTDDESGPKVANIAIKRSMILHRVNTAPEVLLVGYLSIMSHITSHLLGIFNLQGRLRLLNTALWGLCFMSVITWSMLQFSIDDLANQALLRFPTVCIIGFVPHVLLLAGIILCSLIYSLALVLAALSPPTSRRSSNEHRSFSQSLFVAHQNMQANISLASIHVSMHMDFYTALLKTGFSALTIASEAVYLNESLEVNIKQYTWLEENRLRELEETGAHWLGPTFRASTGGHNSERHGMADSVGLVGGKNQLKGPLQASTSGYAQEKVASKRWKPKHAERIIRDGVGASERSGRWLMVFVLLVGISKLIVCWSATVFLKILVQIGVQRRPRWLMRLVQRPKASSRDEIGSNDNFSTLDFWMLGEDGELTLPKNEEVDVEVEMRKRLRGDVQIDEKELDSNIYNWWLNGGWFGGHDGSGDFDPSSLQMDEDTTSVVSNSSETTNEDWESYESDRDISQTPTQRSPQFSRDSTPLFDNPLSQSELTRLLHPKTPEQRAEAQTLAAHLACESTLTRSKYRDLQERERNKVLTSSRNLPLGFTSTSLTAEEEAEILEQMIISRRSFNDTATPTSEAPSSWAREASGIGEGGPQCVVCQSAPRSVIVWPCRCFSLCDDCRVSLAMKNFETCTCCRGRVSSFSRIFVP